jgi:hypothetical protein
MMHVQHARTLCPVRRLIGFRIWWYDSLDDKGHNIHLFSRQRLGMPLVSGGHENNITSKARMLSAQHTSHLSR